MLLRCAAAAAVCVVGGVGVGVGVGVGMGGWVGGWVSGCMCVLTDDAVFMSPYRSLEKDSV